MVTRRQSIPLGRILGIPIGLDLSWFLIFGLLTWSLATNYYPNRFASWPSAWYWWIGAVTAIALFVSVLLHEMGHSVVALAFKIPVLRIRLMIFGGVAELGDQPPSAIAEFLIAIAGPAVSILLAGAFFIAHIVLRYVFIFSKPLMGLFGYLASVNLMLALFNLIPGFPLDGGRVLRALLWGINGNLHQATRIAANVGRIIAFGLIGLGLFQALGGNLSNGLWTVFIGMFMQGAATAEVQQQRIRQMLTDHTVSQAMSRNFVVIPADTSLERIMGGYTVWGMPRTFVVRQGNRAVGLLTTGRIRKISRSEWLRTTAGQAMEPIEHLNQVRPDDELWRAMQQLAQQGSNPLLVMLEGQIYGLLRREDVLGYMRVLQASSA